MIFGIGLLSSKSINFSGVKEIATNTYKIIYLLAWFSFTTRETCLDYYHHEQNIQVSSRVLNQPKT